MQPLLNNLKYNGDDAGHYIKKVVNQSKNIADAAVRTFHKYYPDISASVRSGASRLFVPARNAATVSRKEMQGFGCSLSKGLHRTGLYLITAGAGYLLFKGFCCSTKGERTPAEKVKAHIEEKPVTSALIAAGVGFLAGRILL